MAAAGSLAPQLMQNLVSPVSASPAAPTAPAAAPIAALVGADCLGKPVVRALNSVNIADGFEAGLAIVIVAIVLDRLCKTRSHD